MNSSISAPSLEIYLLGSFQVKINGSPINNKDWQRRASVKLIKILALSPEQRAHREQIIELLWADQYSENLTNNLNKAIHGARRVLEPHLSKPSDSGFIITENQLVGLRAPQNNLFIDVLEFEKSAESGIKNENLSACETALALYKGDLLVEDLYEDWTVSLRERLRLLHRKLVTKTAEIYARGEQFEKSIELLKGLTLTDPTDERVHQELMRLYAITGSKYQAFRQFEICRTALAEIGFLPEAKTQKIKEEIQSGKILPFRKPVDAENQRIDRQTAAGMSKIHVEPARIRKYTFNHGVVQTAQFLPDNRTVVYSASWEENDFQIYKTDRETMESLPVGLSGAGILSVSETNEIAVSLDRRFVRGYKSSGTLASVDLDGNVTDKILENIQWADWKPGQEPEQSGAKIERLAVVRKINGRNRLEYPLGNILFETGGWISHPKFSPKGDKIAFIYHPTLDDDSGSVVAVDLSGQKIVLSENWISIQGLVWHKSGTEIWFTATREGNFRAVQAVSLNGSERLIYKAAGSLTVHDLTDDGAVLVTLNKTQIKIAAKAPGDAKERDLTWHDWSLVRDISADGQTILFTEAGETGGASYATYTRRIDGTNTLLLGEGSALAFSPDARFALVKIGKTPPQLVLYEIAGGRKIPLKSTSSKTFFYQPWAGWFPDGKKFLFAANEADAGTKLYVQEIDGGAVCITNEAEGFEISSPHAISPDGETAAIIHPNKQIYLYSFSKREFFPLPNLEPNYLPVGWSRDGRNLFIRERGRVPAIVFSYELETGECAPVLELCPQYRTGVYEILRVLMTRDRKTYAYSYTREFSDLLVIEGLE
jgi:DNA-binding SARP family transcriptional activator/Tol biopolymer transport system component